MIPVNTGVGGIGGFWLITGFSGGEEGGSCRQKSKKGRLQKIDSRQYRGGGGGSEDFGLSHSFHGERKGITFWQKNTKGSSCSFSEQPLVFEPRSLSANKQPPS